MNTAQVRDMLIARGDDGEYKIPFLVVADAFQSEMVEFADLVLPDTTYLERYDTISILDRPISDADSICDSIRAPVVAPDRDVRPWQEVMVDLAHRLGFPAFVNEDGSARYAGYKDFITRFEKAPGIGFLAGWRGEDGHSPLRGAPNPRQWEMYEENECFFEYETARAHAFLQVREQGLPRTCSRCRLQYQRRANRDGTLQRDLAKIPSRRARSLRRPDANECGRSRAPGTLF